MKNKICDAIILAAGSSKRFKSILPKQFLKFNNKNLIDIAIENLSALKKIRNIYIVLSKNNIYKIKKGCSAVKIIEGGNTRTKSVFKSLKFLSKSKDFPDNILIHDAARPCLNIKELQKLFEKGNNSKIGLSLGYPLTNSLKKVNSKLQVIDNIKRDNFYMSYTPQIFNFTKLFLAYTDIISKGINVDDEIEAMINSGHKVEIMMSSPKNIKLTYQGDIEVIKSLMKKI